MKYFWEAPRIFSQKEKSGQCHVCDHLWLFSVVSFLNLATNYRKRQTSLSHRGSKAPWGKHDCLKYCCLPPGSERQKWTAGSDQYILCSGPFKLPKSNLTYITFISGGQTIRKMTQTAPLKVNRTILIQQFSCWFTIDVHKYSNTTTMQSVYMWRDLFHYLVHISCNKSDNANMLYAMIYWGTVCWRVLLITSCTHILSLLSRLSFLQV